MKQNMRARGKNKKKREEEEEEREEKEKLGNIERRRRPRNWMYYRKNVIWK